VVMFGSSLRADSFDMIHNQIESGPMARAMAFPVRSLMYYPRISRMEGLSSLA
jgi:hypothetical protein